MYKLYTQTVPDPLLGIIPQTSDFSVRHTRHRRDFVNVCYKNSIVDNSFLSEGPRLWNNLSQNIKKLTYKQFSKHLKESYIDKY